MESQDFYYWTLNARRNDKKVVMTLGTGKEHDLDCTFGLLEGWDGPGPV
jgi:hypothetical protein